MNLIQRYSVLKENGQLRIGGSGPLNESQLAAIGVVGDETFMVGYTFNDRGEKQKADPIRLDLKSLRAERDRMAGDLATMQALIADVESLSGQAG